MFGFPDSAGATPWKPNALTPYPTSSPTCGRGSSNYGGIFDYDSKAEKLIEVSKQLEDPNVWNDAAHAQELGKEKKALENVVVTLDTIGQGITGFSTLALGSIVTFFAIIAGSAATMKYQYWRLMQEE